jgi:hypothetical protein
MLVRIADASESEVLWWLGSGDTLFTQKQRRAVLQMHSLLIQVIVVHLSALHAVRNYFSFYFVKHSPAAIKIKYKL